ncbi:Na+/H+ antiporter subunit G [Marinomonas sp. 15G1-11]|uniref:Na+/H+ antiporter subunit G n=1 Tax=Marinomonas phaeophyticola TaxID=3004091 RepID=A0ABT4JVC4_9GAMM|nr:Na+/H+ antiporter subunit G [Marinomonas sp. 15G1-11]MCZ2722190.1 Na+/H+ antiporter subunit G [Marinomonas sp. 15G1-11]
MNFFVEAAAASLLIFGGIFLLIGSIGLARLPDIYTRLHAPTKATTLGIAGVLVASCIIQTNRQGSLSINEWLITLFLMITAPVAANMIAKAALHHDIEPIHRTQGKELMKTARERQAPTAQAPEDKK